MLGRFTPSVSVKRLFRSHICRDVSGRATSAGTRYFLEQSKLSFHHALKKSNLYINPVIVGKPMAGTGQNEELDSLYVGAVLQKRSNCFHVYSKNSEGSWHTNAVKKLVDARVDREGLVTIADIGTVRTKEDIIRNLEEAWELTELEYIDIALMKYDSDWKEGIVGDFQSCMDFMEQLCDNKIMHSYGFSLDIEPFNQHTPPVGGHFGNVLTPGKMETHIEDYLPHCELVLYPLSPTHAMPTATSMLPEAIESMDASDGLWAAPSASPANFTRAAVEPLCCYRGHGNPENDPTDPLEKLETMENVSDEAILTALESHRRRREAEGKAEGDPGAPRADDPMVLMANRVLPPEMSSFFCGLFDQIVPALATTPQLEFKILRVVLSYGHEVVVMEPEVCALIDKIPLTKRDIMSIDDVEKVFGGFMISEEVDGMMREAAAAQEGLDMDSMVEGLGDMEMTEEDQKFLDELYEANDIDSTGEGQGLLGGGEAGGGAVGGGGVQHNSKHPHHNLDLSVSAEHMAMLEAGTVRKVENTHNNSPDGSGTGDVKGQ